ncbi:MAG TPA: porin family protein [Bryobacteraceae bacterium]|jgi:opacity protein-like surface antigen|nr:porin family protein [Bryobacteraceae bacterium]
MNKLAPAFIALLVALPVVSRAQTAEFWVGAGSSFLSNGNIGSTSPAGTQSDVQLTNGFRINFRLTLNTKRFMGHEVGYAYNRTHLHIFGQDSGGMAIHQGFYNFLLYGIPEGRRVRPFATGGIHFSNFVPPGSSAQYGGGQTKFGFNYGFGVKARVTNSIGVRLDYRQYNTGKPFDLPLASGRLLQNEISVSVGWMLL